MHLASRSPPAPTTGRSRRWRPLAARSGSASSGTRRCGPSWPSCADWSRPRRADDSPYDHLLAPSNAVTTDVLGEPWTAETIHFPPDEEGPVVATLVSRKAPEPTGKAVLYVHGFCDYFFQTDFAQWWLDRGYDFYALDLRKYGRSLLPHQLPNYVTDLSEHYAEIDAAWHRITVRDGHDEVVVSAHSTGGLTCSLWADLRRPPELKALVLNSPWLDLQGSAMMR